MLLGAASNSMDSADVITEEQRKRSEANRMAAIAKRQASAASKFTARIVTASNSKPATTSPNPWRLFKCRKLSSNLPTFTKPQSPPSIDQRPEFQAPIEKFRARVEICSPDSFCITTFAIQDCKYPGESQCLKKLKDCLSNVDPSRYTQDIDGGKACVYKLTNYHMVLKCLKNSKNIEVEEIPWSTFNVVERLSYSFNMGRWNPCRPEHLSDEKVDELIRKLPKALLGALMPFQMEGLKFALQRGGRCLIADEMGLGKTLQAIAAAGCFREEGSILVVCPAILRYSWAEELERWFPFCVPTDIHLVFSHQNSPTNLPKLPKIVVTSYTMLKRLQKGMLKQDWAFLIVDESHHVRCARKASEPEEIKVVIDLASRIKRIILLSGTPSLSKPYDMFHQIDMLWPGLLGRTKYDFARTYCDVEPRGCSNFTDFSNGIRLQELNVLLKQTVMIRRLKQHVLMQLPPKRRQIIRLTLKRSDIASATAAVRTCSHPSPNNSDQYAANDVECDTPHTSSWNLSFQELGIAKLSGFCEWLSLHPIAVERDDGTEFNEASPLNCHKMLIFAHHHKVLDGIQYFLCEKDFTFIRIDGNTLAKDRQSAVRLFQSSKEVRIAIIGVTAACVGLDFSVAQHVVFLELPQTPSMMLQAEDRAHRRGQSAAVNIYVFCAKDTIDESHWQTLNRSLLCVSSATDGKYDAVHGITVHDIANFGEDSGFNCKGREQSLMKTEVSGKESVELPRSSETDGGRSQRNDLYVKDAVSSAQVGENNTNFSCEVQQSDSVSGVLSGELCPELDDVTEAKSQSDHLKNINGHSQIADESCSTEMNSFRFEVSQYTGRIHLYSVSERDTRPAALFQSVRVEEVSSLHSEMQFITQNLPLRDALLTFVNEWNNLRPIERRKLTGKPLQLPLAIELCCMKENMNHNSQGLIKCGSKRRITPLSDISNPLPHGAIWKTICLHSGHGQKEKMYKQGWNLLNEPLCKLCQIPCKSSNAKTPEFFEDLFCSLDCYAEYRLRTSHQFRRQELFQIENGVCMNCKLDCHKLVKSLKFLPLDKRQHCIERVAPRIADRESLFEKLVNDPIPGNAWHADHIIPVFRGGGECRLENLRTLCVACHYDVTASQLAGRRFERSKAKQQLKLILQGLKHSNRLSKMGQSKMDGDEHLDLPGKLDDELLVNVPGSAYC